jgi:hypothetical protein
MSQPTAQTTAPTLATVKDAADKAAAAKDASDRAAAFAADKAAVAKDAADRAAAAKDAADKAAAAKDAVDKAATAKDAADRAATAKDAAAKDAVDKAAAAKYAVDKAAAAKDAVDKAAAAKDAVDKAAAAYSCYNLHIPTHSLPNDDWMDPLPSGATISVACKPGYTPTKGGRYTCDKGTLNPPKVDCVPLACYKLPLPAHGSMGAGWQEPLPSGESNIVLCDPGYTPHGNYTCDKGVLSQFECKPV